MRNNRSIPSAVVIPVLIYPDVREAVAFSQTLDDVDPQTWGGTLLA
jgi:hypothetical protein